MALCMYGMLCSENKILSDHSRDQNGNVSPNSLKLRRCLGFAVLLRRSKARRTESSRIPRLPRLEVACNAKVHQVQVCSRGQHDIGPLHIAKNDRRLVMVQVVEHGTQLNAEVEHLPEWKTGLSAQTEAAPCSGRGCNTRSIQKRLVKGGEHICPISCIPRVCLDEKRFEPCPNIGQAVVVPNQKTTRKEGRQHGE